MCTRLLNNSSNFWCLFQLNLNPITSDGALFLFKTILDTPTSSICDVNIAVSNICFASIPFGNQRKRRAEFTINLLLQNQSIEESTAQLLDDGITQQQRSLRVIYGHILRKKEISGSEADSINDDPLIVLMEYMRQKNMRLLDLFNSLDTDGSKSLSRQEFREGLQVFEMEFHDVICITQYCMNLNVYCRWLISR